jgi:starch synthase
MNVLFVSAEVAPYVSIGGLSQVMYFLPKELRKLGNDVRTFTAKYGAMDIIASKKNWIFKKEYSHLAVPVNGTPETEETLICNVLSHTSRDKSITYFLENREYYELRANVYGYIDDHIRFGFLSKGALEWLLQIKEKTGWWPDVIHCHDWHTGYLIDLARRSPRYMDAFKDTAIVYTVHNFSIQGNYDFKYCKAAEYDDGKSPLASIKSRKFQTQNPLKRGLLYANAVNTVSPTHSVEVLTPQYSEGLDEALQLTKKKLTGFLNGLDIDNFNPQKDKYIKKQFNAENHVKNRAENKKDLQKFFGLPLDPTSPVISFVGRLYEQKGIDYILEVLPHLLKERPDVQVVILGTGIERFRLELSVLQKKFPKQMGLHLRTDFKLPRKIFAGSDMMLIPSIFEPGGIIALETMRYGCVPIVRRTGGLNDIVTDFNPADRSGNGFSFGLVDSWALYGAVMEALTIYKSPSLWKALVRNCMLSDFSWDTTAKQYSSWYKRVLKDQFPKRYKK